ncbi:MAG: HD domain-containing protein [Planctomycetales bacterium]|nr:HD domain-containing protein [Planctomycetales bacterium]
MDTLAFDNSCAHQTQYAELRNRLREAFGVAFSVFDGDSGELLGLAEDQPWLAADVWPPLVRGTARFGLPDIIADEDSVVVLAIPVTDESIGDCVAVGTFLADRRLPSQLVESLSQRWGCTPATLNNWLRRQPLWPAEALIRSATSVRAALRAERDVERLEVENEGLSNQLTHTFEEISLLYGVTRNLRLSRSVTDLGQMALGWLSGCVPAKSLALWLMPDDQDSPRMGQASESQPNLLLHGDHLASPSELQQLVRYLGLTSDETAVVANRDVTSDPSWPLPHLSEVIITPVTEGKQTLGYLVALNHSVGGEFGSIEASLLGSIAALLGIHAGNHRLYRKQALLLENFVRALTSAIDAKDPYTCGHSDRVAQISVRLAQQLGWAGEDCETIYLAGVLHDIGKIGIDDAVLRKPGKLTAEEYEHIKEHPEKGYRILEQIGELSHILPAVLHHHEQWDGNGYPHGLTGETIPLIARIVAVADSFDAMTSDRPYRKGMPLEKVDQIFREGSGQQWDARVVNAYFDAQNDITAIIARDEN